MSFQLLWTNERPRISFGAFVGLLPNPVVNMGSLETAGERVGLVLTGISFACLVGTLISEPLQEALWITLETVNLLGSKVVEIKDINNLGLVYGWQVVGHPNKLELDPQNCNDGKRSFRWPFG